VLILNPLTVYHRTVLVLFREEDDLDVLGADGVQYAMQTLTRANGLTTEPSAKDRKRAEYILCRLNVNDKKTARFMADLAVQWNDLAMWNRVVKQSGSERNVDVLEKERLVQASKQFSFEAVRITWVPVAISALFFVDLWSLVLSGPCPKAQASRMFSV
jgi:mannose-1-phosphate guanylyltransferase